MASELARAAQKAREWTVRRDELIRQESEVMGRSLRSIAVEAGISHTAVRKILAR